jgi:hypothetical protein
MVNKVQLIFSTFFFSICFIFLVGVLCAQEIHGSIKSLDGRPISNVLVNGLDDSFKIVVFSQTNEFGVFKIKYSLDKEPKFLFINHIDFQPDTVNLFNRTDTLKIILEDRFYVLPEVKVEEVRQLYENSVDTTIFNVESFRDGHERSIEEVLSKLPGIKLSEEGIITFRGKTVSNVLIDYDDLFGKRYAIGTKSMNPVYVEEFEFIDKYEKESLLQGISSSDELVLNLKLKEDFKIAVFGDGEIGAGIPKRYLARGNMFSMSERNKGVAISNFNNVAYEAFNLMNYIETGGSAFDELNYQRSLYRLIGGPYYSKAGLSFDLQSLSNNNTVSLNNISQLGSLKSDTKVNLTSIRNRFNESNLINYLGEDEIFFQNFYDTVSQKGVVLFNELTYSTSERSKILLRSEISLQNFSSESTQELGRSVLNTGFLNFLSDGNSFRQSYNVEYLHKLNSSSVIKLNYTYINEKFDEQSNNYINDIVLLKSLGLKTFSQNLDQKINDHVIGFNMLSSINHNLKTNIGFGVGWIGDRLGSSLQEVEHQVNVLDEVRFARSYNEPFLESKILYNFKPDKAIDFTGRLSNVNIGLGDKFLYKLNMGYQSSISSNLKMISRIGYSRGLVNAIDVSNLRYYSDYSSLVVRNSPVNLYENGFLLGSLIYSFPKEKMELQWSTFGSLVRNVAQRTTQQDLATEQENLGRFFKPSINSEVSLDKYLKFIKSNFNLSVSYFRMWDKNQFNKFQDFETENTTVGLIISTNNIGFLNLFASNKVIKNQFSSFGEDGLNVRNNLFFQTKYGISVSPLNGNQLKIHFVSSSFNSLASNFNFKDNQFLEINSSYIINERNNITLMIKNMFNRNSFNNIILNPYSQQFTSVSVQNTFFYLSYFFRFSS